MVAKCSFILAQQYLHRSQSSPQPGMMIFVTGTGLQVRGTSAWNTVAGTAT
jgi:hypothetical protein